MEATPFAGRSLHFVGIGGAGMSGLARVAQSLGARVTGSDQAESDVLERLRAEGIDAIAGHDAANLPEGAELVVSTAIPDDNPELAAARAAGVAVLHRGDLLGELSRMKRTIAVGGAHGKTTTASMAAHVLRGAGRDPAFLIGGELRSAGTNAAWGTGDWAVIEADESDRSFLKLNRDVAVVTNIELDHHSTYASLAELEQAFAEFAEPADLRVLGPDVDLPGEAVRIELDDDRVELLPGGSRFEADGVPVELSVPGRHNVLNALAAMAACRAAGVELPEAAAALADFSGAGRRFEPHGTTPAARSSSTTTPTTRPRCAPRSRPPARRRRGGDSSPASNPICSRGRGLSRVTSGRRSRSPTWRSSSTSTAPASGPRTSRA